MLNLLAKPTSGNPSTCEVGDIYINDVDNTALVCTSANTWEQMDNPDVARDTRSTAVTLTTAEKNLASATTTASVAGNEMWIVATGEFTSAATHATTGAGIDMKIRKGGDCTGTQIGATVNDVMTAADTQINTVSFVDTTATSTIPVAYSLCVAETGVGSDVAPNDRSIVVYEISKDVGADLAEVYYSHDNSLMPGEILAIDGTLQAGVKRANNVYQKDLLGVVSTKPGLVFSDHAKGENPVMVALVGRVPVKVSDENGKIKPGDLLTSSSAPGVAMRATKAGPILGQALTEMVGNGIGQALMYVKPGWYNGAPLDELLAGLTFETGEEINFGGEVLKQFVREQSVTASSTKSDLFADRLAAELEIVTPKITARDLIVDTITAGKITANEISGLDALFATTTAIVGQVEALSASALALKNENGEIKQTIEMIRAEDAGMEEKLNLTSQTISALTMEVEELKNRLAVVTSYFDFNFTDALKVIKGLRVDGLTVLDGGLRVDSIGAISTQIALLSDTLFIGRPYFNNDTGGFALIPAGATYVDVVFEKEYLEQPVVNATVSLEELERGSDGGVDTEIIERLKEVKLLGSDIKYIVSKKSVKGFRISLNKPLDEDLRFSWIALAVKDAKTFSSKEEIPTSEGIDGGGGTAIENIDGGEAGEPIDGGSAPETQPPLAEQPQIDNETIEPAAESQESTTDTTASLDETVQQSNNESATEESLAAESAAGSETVEQSSNEIDAEESAPEPPPSSENAAEEEPTASSSAPS